MKGNNSHKLFVLGMTIVLVACAGGISRETRSQVTYFGSFAELQQHPETYRQEIALLGGRVIETLAKPQATEIMVLQLPLDGSGRPVDNDQSQGRFIVRSGQFLDPAIYAKGSMVTLVGRFTDTRQQPIGEMLYDYPVVDVMEIKKWNPESLQSPRFHFGFGIGTRF